MNDNKMAIDQHMPDETKVDQNELKLVYEGPGVYINKIYLGMDGPNIRITFMEQVPESEVKYFRTAVVMPLEGLITLNNITTQFLNAYMKSQMAKNPVIRKAEEPKE